MLIDDLKAQGYERIKPLPSGLCGLMRFITTHAIVVGLTDRGYRGRYCYEHKQQAVDAIMEWNGEGDPPGPWIKYKGIDGERLGPGALCEDD